MKKVFEMKFELPEFTEHVKPDVYHTEVGDFNTKGKLNQVLGFIGYLKTLKDMELILKCDKYVVFAVVIRNLAKNYLNLFEEGDAEFFGTQVAQYIKKFLTYEDFLESKLDVIPSGVGKYYKIEGIEIKFDSVDQLVAWCVTKAINDKSFKSGVEVN